MRDSLEALGRVALATLALASGRVGLGADEAARRPVSPEDTYSLRVISGLEVSPDGRSVAYVVDAADRVFTGADFRFTSRSHLGAEYRYATPLGDPIDGAYTIRSFGTSAGLLTAKVRDVALFGESERPQWEQTAEGLVVRTDKRAVIKVTLEPDTTQPRCGDRPLPFES